MVASPTHRSDIKRRPRADLGWISRPESAAEARFVGVEKVAAAAAGRGWGREGEREGVLALGEVGREEKTPDYGRCGIKWEGASEASHGNGNGDLPCSGALFARWFHSPRLSFTAVASARWWRFGGGSLAGGDNEGGPYVQ